MKINERVTKALSRAGLISLSSVIVPLSLFVSAPSVYAYQIIQTNQPLRGDFVLEPAKIELVGNPGSSKEVDLTITNRDSNTRTFSVSTEDIMGSSDPSIPVILLGTQKGKWSFRDDLVPETTSFTLKPGEQIILPVTVQVPSTAEPGGKYASVIVSNSSGQTTSTTGSQNVARLTALFLVQVPGEALIGGSLDDFYSSVKSVTTNEDPILYHVVFRNTGNVHLDPKGHIDITNFYGKQVGTVTVDPFYTLPQSVRDRPIQWTHDTLFGRYTATLYLDEGFGSTTATKQITFWILPLVYIVYVIIGVVLLAGAGFFLFRKFEIRRK